MSASLSIWSKEPTLQKKTLFGILDAAYESRLMFYIDGYNRYQYKNMSIFSPSTLTISKDVSDNIPMLFGISPIEAQTWGSDKYENQSFKDYHGISIIFPCIYQLACSENIDYEMSFQLTYFYLMKNPDHLIRCESTLFDWETIKEVYQKGYSEGWLYKK
jgi:hypothetical protein